MSDYIQENSLSLLSRTTGVDLNAAADTEKGLYTCPTGKKGIPVLVVAHTFSAACAAAVGTFGETGGSCDEFLGDQTLTNISGTGDYLIIQPVPNATPPKGVILDAGDVFGYEVTTAEGSALTCVMDVFGYEYDA
jgi:hypothetical protein